MAQRIAMSRRSRAGAGVGFRRFDPTDWELRDDLGVDFRPRITTIQEAPKKLLMRASGKDRDAKGNHRR